MKKVYFCSIKIEENFFQTLNKVVIARNQNDAMQICYKLKVKIRSLTIKHIGQANKEIPVGVLEN